MSHRSTSDPASAVRRRLLALLGLGAAAGLAACGKKGPLRLPEPAPPASGSSDEETPSGSADKATPSGSSGGETK